MYQIKGKKTFKLIWHETEIYIISDKNTRKSSSLKSILWKDLTPPPVYKLGAPGKGLASRLLVKVSAGFSTTFLFLFDR
jgi:hypothetical protein